MSKFVVDAHALIWHVEGNPRLGSLARIALQDPSRGCSFPQSRLRRRVMSWTGVASGSPVRPIFYLPWMLTLGLKWSRSTAMLWSAA